MKIATSSSIAALAFLVAGAAVAAPPKPGAGKTGPSIALASDVVSVKQLTITIDPAGDAKANGERAAAFQSATLGIFSCADADEVARTVGAEVEDNPALPVNSLPPSLRTTIATMKTGTATQVFGDHETGKVSVLVLCARR